MISPSLLFNWEAVLRSEPNSIARCQSAGKADKHQGGLALSIDTIARTRQLSRLRGLTARQAAPLISSQREQGIAPEFLHK